MGTQRLDRTRSWLTFWIVMGSVAMVICLWRDTLIVQADVRERVETALAGRGMDASSTVYADGRDITVRGRISAKSDRHEVVHQLRSLLGVRTVVDELTVVVRQPTQLILDVADRTARLHGVLGDQDSIDEIIRAVARIHGVKRIDNRMRVSEFSHRPNWIDGLIAFLPWYAVGPPSRLTISDKTLLLEGIVGNSKQREIIEKQANAAFLGTMPVANSIRVLAGELPSGRIGSMEFAPARRDHVQAIDNSGK